MNNAAMNILVYVFGGHMHSFLISKSGIGESQGLSLLFSSSLHNLYSYFEYH